MGITSTGIGSGLDVETIVSKLMAVEQRPVTLLQTAATDLKATLSSYGQMQSNLSAFQDKANALTSLSLWSQTIATSSDTTAVTATTGANAAPGSYSISVEKMAAAQTATSRAFDSSDEVVGQGSLTIELGSWSGTPATSFATKPASNSVTIDIGAGETSLAAIRDKINSAGAGVTASIVNDASGARLSIRSTDTGVENGFRITATESADDGDPGRGLSALSYAGGEGASQMQLNRSAANAEATINGISVTSASNTLDNVADGLTVTLQKVTTAPISVGVTRDDDAVKTAMNDFVTAYNNLSSFISTQTAYNPDNKKGGQLQGDRTTVSLQTQMRSIVGSTSSASSLYGRLSDIGLEVQKDGTLKLNSSKLSDGLSHRDDMRKLLINDGGDSPGANGIMRSFKKLVDDELGSEGPITTRQAGIQKSIDNNSKRQDDLQQRLDQTEKRLRAQYQLLDTNMATLTSLSSYLTQQLSSLKTSA